MRECHLVCTNVLAEYPYPNVPSTSPNADVSYAYDAGGTRVLRASVHSAEPTTYSAEIFPSLRFNHAQWLPATDRYDVSLNTEAVYLTLGGGSYGRLAYNPSAPNINGYLHVYLELNDTLGSTSVVIDRDTSELVERTTYLAVWSRTTGPHGRVLVQRERDFGRAAV